MRFRFFQVMTLACILAGAFAGVARALDFDDEDPQPVQTEVGRVLEYVIGTHAGCLPHRLEIQSGSLPPGTTLVKTQSPDDQTLRDHSTFEVTGTPTEAGTYSVWLALRDCDNRSAESLFTFDVAQRTYSIETTSLPVATPGASYTAKLAAGGHAIQSEQWTLASGSLPSGLTLASDGTISGTPTASGSSTFTVKATSVGDDGAIRVDTKELTLRVTGSFSVSASRRVAELGRPFSSTLTLSGGQPAVTWSASSGVPAGLSVTPQGLITGVPKQAGAYTVAVHFAGSGGFGGDVKLQLVVRPRLAIAARALAAAALGRAYHAAVAIRGGVTPLRWSAKGLPRGLTLSAASGKIAGKAKTRGSFRVKVRVRDALGAVATKTLALRVR